jgi:excisionase family DNA binding protein
MSELRLSLDDDALDRIAEALAARLGNGNGPEPWVGVDRAAEHLSCKRQRIYDLVSRGEIPHRKDGSRLLFRLSDLDAWLAEP